ncbi:hypothetical protein MIND_00364900 [Mycena indigotica]|uniref:Uncharacterized protein n=1 Tax=Mycena indigotica TaxID=2126181 RepID=A0A8H6T472_9AGAR|nr:uncharacterized protein MIND_00364900 [Mycena indigotica]KAF7309926.1 hypothetical protein MIND_00364900 [Mycena indigotica]
MRRAQSVRNHTRPSLAFGADDLGVLREANETTEEALRRQLIEKDRENDRLKSQIETLQGMLSQRPDVESVQELQREYKSLELLLAGTQRENERSMAEIERGKAREKLLEGELAKLAGENWQSALDIAPPNVSGTAATITGRSFLHSRSNTLSAHASPVLAHAQAASVTTASPIEDPRAQQQQTQATLAHIEQVRLLIMGMEQRLQTREEKLVKSVQRAESEGRRFEELRREAAGR